MCQILSPCLRVGASRDRHPQAVCRIQDLTMLYAKLFLPVDDCIGTEEEEGAEGWQILHQFFVEWVITQAPISQYTWAPTSYIMRPVTGRGAAETVAVD